MRFSFFLASAACVVFALDTAEQISADNLVRIHEFYRLAAQIEDQIWPEWSVTPTPLLLVTPKTEFLTHAPHPIAGFTRVSEDFQARPRQFSTELQATFPAFGPPAVIVTGEPANTASLTSTPWLIVLVHEHFHQLQYAQTGYYQAVQELGLSGGDSTGEWMLQYPFPYDKPQIAGAFAHLRDLLLSAVQETDPVKFERRAGSYVRERKRFLAQLTSDDHKYFGFQLWQEGIARYTQIKAAEAALIYRPTGAFTALADFEPFESVAATARRDTLQELKRLDLATAKRVAFYSFGGAEGLLLDRLVPKWKNEYFKHLLSTDALFDRWTFAHQESTSER